MSLPKGWVSGDVWAFEQLLIKANDQQLCAALTAIASHQRSRLERASFPSSFARRYRDNREGPKGSPTQSRASFSNEPGRDYNHPRHEPKREENAAGILRSPPRPFRGNV